MKLNLGCGFNYKQGWLNLDKYSITKPDIVWDLEVMPWPIESESITEVLLNHVLEHIGGSGDIFLKIMQEIYRVCRPNALIAVNVPNPFHDDYLSDPTHVRMVTPGLFKPFDLLSNEQWISQQAPGTPIAAYLKVDFSPVSVKNYATSFWSREIAEGRITQEHLESNARHLRNVIEWSSVSLKVCKPFLPGKLLRSYEALIISRSAGLGDVLMALQALAVVRFLAPDLVIVFITDKSYHDFLYSTGVINRCVTSIDEAKDYIEKIEKNRAIFRDWSAVKHGVSRFHEVESFLLDVGIMCDEQTISAGISKAQSTLTKVRSARVQPKASLESKLKILIHPGVTDPNRTLDVEIWVRVIAELKRIGHHVAVIGSTKCKDGKRVSTQNLGADETYVDSLSLLETFGLMLDYDVLISTDSGPIQLGVLADISIVGIYSVVHSSTRLPFWRSSSSKARFIGLDSSCPYAPCYRYMGESDKVSEFLVSEGIGTDDTPKIFSNWCVNQVRYSCMKDDNLKSQLTRVIESIRAENNEVS